MNTVVPLRPFYETEEDRKDEKRIAETVAAARHVILRRMPRAYPVDWAVLQDRRSIRAFMEIKGRRRYSMAQLDELGGVFVSLQKWARATGMAELSRKPLVLIVETREGIWCHRYKGEPPDDTVWDGRDDRGDAEDKEPVILLRARRFVAL